MRTARAITVVLAAAGAAGAVSVIAYMHHRNSASTLPPLSTSVQRDSPLAVPAEANESSFSEPLPLGSRFGYNQPAPPPVLFHVGRSPEEAGVPDLSTPAVAMQSILSLIDQAATDQLAPCLFTEMEDPLGDLYPRCLGRPVALVEVIEDEDSAKVVWEAAVHTEFSLYGRRWTPGETITLTSHLTRVEGQWKLLRLHEGEENDVQQRDASAS